MNTFTRTTSRPPVRHHRTGSASFATWFALVLLSFDALADARQCRAPRADGGVTCPDGWGVCKVVSGKDEWLARDDDLDAEPATRVWVDTDGDGRPEATVERTFTATGRPLVERFDHNGNGVVDEELRHEYDADGHWVTTRHWARANPNPPSRDRYQYDGGLLVTQLDSNWHPTVRYEYDRARRLTRVVSGLLERRLSRNDAGLVVDDSTSFEGRPQRSVRSTIDATGRLVLQETTQLDTRPPRVVERRVLASEPEEVAPAEENTRVLVLDDHGRVTERFEFEGGPFPVRYVSTFDRDGRESRMTRYQRYGEPQSRRFTRDALGRVTQVAVFDGPRPQWTETYRFEHGRIVEAVTPAATTHAVIVDGLVRQRRTSDPLHELTTHFDYDPAQLERWKKTAPLACDASEVSDPFRVEPQPPAVPIVTGLTLRHFAAAASPSDGGVDESLGAALYQRQRELFTAARERALESAGLEWLEWTSVPVDDRRVSSPPRGALLIAKAVDWCGAPDEEYVFARRTRTVSRLDVHLVCSETQRVVMKGTLAEGGCGHRPPTADWYVLVPKGTTLEDAATQLELVLPRCVEVQPLGGFERPP